ncbi:PKD domain-containing protein [Halorussus lipolyticus]|uniref:PKD domain-containing protein n=1 Tax=Halorussus lipolyticus TaxID=3034024 RepID=UPI0023E8D683|nr:PKD domain-containing protein [Halorussus sp. DT80]
MIVSAPSATLGFDGPTTGPATAAAANDTLTASVEYSPSSPAPDETVTFDASGSTASGTIDDYEWDVDGDGYVEEYGSQTTYSYDTAGTYTVTLWVTNGEGETDKETVSVSVENDAPKASFSYSPTDPAPDDTITFDAGDSSDSDGRITDYEWDLDGDGYVEEYGSQTTYSYDTAGSYTVTLWVTDNGDRTVKKIRTVEVGNDAPNATFSYSPTDPAPDDTITFDAGDSSDADGRITDYEWDVDGDGYVEEYGSQTSHSFETAGTYTVTLWVTDNGDATTKKIRTVEVGNDAPNATFSYSPTDPAPDDTITFDAGDSSDADGRITDYEWDVDNDGYVEEYGSQTSHSFDTAGTYTVTLWVTDNGDRTVKKVRTIEVENTAPKVSVSHTPSNPSPGDSVTLDAGGSSDPDGKIDDYEWDVDDDGYVEEYGSRITHTFEDEGRHTVTLWVTDNGDRTVKKTYTVAVGDVATTQPDPTTRPDPTTAATDPDAESRESTDSADDSDESGESDDTSGDSSVDSTDGNSFANGELFQVARLYAPEKVIEPGSPGRLAGAFTADVTNDKATKVQITLQVPSGIQISGGSDIESSGGGLPTTTFVIQPGETKDISAQVTGSAPGTYTLRAAITYFPVGNKSAAREYDDLTLDFEVRGDSTANAALEDDQQSRTKADGESSSGTPGFTLGSALVALLAAAMLARRSR